MPIPAPGSTAVTTAGGVTVKVGVIVGVFVGVFVIVDVGVDVEVGGDVDVGVDVGVRLAGIRVGLGVFLSGISVGQGMTPPEGSTQVAWACALVYGIKRKNRIPNPNKTRITCGFLIPFSSLFRVNLPA